MLSDLCQEVRDFIRVCEAIHFKVRQGGLLTSEERAVLVFSANDLLKQLEVTKSETDWQNGLSKRDVEE
ncbi:MAG TPA: hypothetical protein VFS39_17140 [Nitrospira sp.]|nr:hypothetical protein [Nitrospira sp.]